MPVVFHVEFTAGSDLGNIKPLTAGDEEGGGGVDRTSILGRKNANIANGHNTSDVNWAWSETSRRRGHGEELENNNGKAAEHVQRSMRLWCFCDIGCMS